MTSVSFTDTTNMFNKESLEFLGLSEKEYRILESVKSTPKNILAISKDVKIPRATLYLIIRKLHQRGFILCKKFGNRFKYLSIQELDLKSKLLQITSQFDKVANLELTQEKKPTKNKWLSSFFK
jgi:predicted transcriptional regulator